MSSTDDRAAFEEKVRTQARALGRDPQVFETAVSALRAADKYDYNYLWSWMGVPIIQLPADIMATQEVIWATKPTSSSRPASPAAVRCCSWRRCWS